MAISSERFSTADRTKFHYRSRRGTAAVEYALVLALIVVVCIGNLRLLGTNSARAFQAISQALDSGGSSTGSTARTQVGPPANSLAAPTAPAP
jgi:Flp pilus assembly pilin Flp